MGRSRSWARRLGMWILSRKEKTIENWRESEHYLNIKISRIQLNWNALTCSDWRIVSRASPEMSQFKGYQEGWKWLVWTFSWRLQKRARPVTAIGFLNEPSLQRKDDDTHLSLLLWLTVVRKDVLRIAACEANLVMIHRAPLWYSDPTHYYLFFSFTFSFSFSLSLPLYRFVSLFLALMYWYSSVHHIADELPMIGSSMIT